MPAAHAGVSKAVQPQSLSQMQLHSAQRTAQADYEDPLKITSAVTNACKQVKGCRK